MLVKIRGYFGLTGGYLPSFREGLLEALMFAALAVAVWQLLSLAAGLNPPRRLRSLDGQKEFKRIQEYYPEIVGAFLGLAVMGQHVVFAVAAAIAGAGLGRLGKKAFGWFLQKLTEEKRVGEVLLLYDVISIYSAAGYSLHEALTAGTYLLTLLKSPLLKCLQNWGYGPQRALKKMGEEINIPEGYALSRILQRAVVIGPAKLAEFLKQESMTMESIRQHRIEQGLGVRPLVQTLYLFFPGLALIGVTLLPIGYHVAKAIMSVKLAN